MSVIRNKLGQIQKGSKFSKSLCRSIGLGKIAYFDKIGRKSKDPWDQKWRSINDRIGKKNKKYKCYRNIKNLITPQEIKVLWFRDKANLMKRPSLDRKNSKKNYTFKNCRFVEFNDNCATAVHNSVERRKNARRQWKDPKIRLKMISAIKTAIKKRKRNEQ